MCPFRSREAPPPVAAGPLRQTVLSGQKAAFRGRSSASALAPRRGCEQEPQIPGGGGGMKM